MFSSKNLTYICTILECIEKIIIYIQGFSVADNFVWANDQLNYNATWSLLLVIGEETKKIDKSLKASYPIIPWRQLAGIRDHLAHDYRGVDAELIFNISKYELSLLKSTLLLMMDDIEYEQGALIAALNSPYYSHIQYLRERLNDE